MKKEIGYDIYIDLLRDAAQQYDLSIEKNCPKKQCKSKRNIYTYDTIDPNDDFYDANEDENNIHDVDTILYELNFGQSVPTPLPHDAWFGLTNNDNNARKNISQSGKANILKLLNALSSPQNSNSGTPQRTTQKVHLRDNRFSKPQAANMTQFDKFISLYHIFCEEGDDNNIEDQVNKDEPSTDDENLEKKDQLYEILTKDKEIEQSIKDQVTSIVFFPKLMKKAYFLSPVICR